MSRRAHFPGFLLLWAAGFGIGCGPSYPESEYPPAPPAGVNVTEEDYTPAPPGTIWRRDLTEVLDAGLGRFLQRVDVKPEVDQGDFVGFRVIELRPVAWWQGVDLVPGDVVTQVNGMPIERPNQAHEAFESLRHANKLVVQYLRGGARRELTYTILDKPGATAPSAPPAATPGAAPAAATPAATPAAEPAAPIAPVAPPAQPRPPASGAGTKP